LNKKGLMKEIIYSFNSLQEAIIFCMEHNLNPLYSIKAIDDKENKQIKCFYVTLNK